MLKCGAISSDVSPTISSLLIAFKPRQVLLAAQQRRSTSMAKNPAQLNPGDESVLTYSIALWLDNRGFSKVLKRFISAAQIQDDDWKAKALNLNEIFSNYLEIRKGARADSKDQKKQEEQIVGSVENNGITNCTASEEIECKKKKKKKNKVNELNVNSKEKQNDKISNDEKACEVAVDLSTKKQNDNKKKKSKLPSEPMEIDEKQIGEGKEGSKVIVESKDTKKKKKKDKMLAEKDASSIEIEDNESKGEKKILKNEAIENGVDESKKASKKRKRMASDENENHPDEEVAVEESKPKKTKGQQNNEESIFAKQNDENTNGTLFNIGVDSLSAKKSARKQLNGSAEPKTVNVFQRVKIEEVKFADERLQDNSYWAKDGAEIGYGAKAQEVLGQVKGRDFRHEKTKKKRGSYRGGLIDQSSHSVKFNYSDEE